MLAAWNCADDDARTARAAALALQLTRFCNMKGYAWEWTRGSAYAIHGFLRATGPPAEYEAVCALHRRRIQPCHDRTAEGLVAHVQRLEFDCGVQVRRQRLPVRSRRRSSVLDTACGAVTV